MFFLTITIIVINTSFYFYCISILVGLIRSRVGREREESPIMHALRSPVTKTMTTTPNMSPPTELASRGTPTSNVNRPSHTGHHSPTSDSDEITSLKDLNVADTTQLSSVLHGRKAATYLRIFREDDGPEVPRETTTTQDTLVPIQRSRSLEGKEDSSLGEQQLSVPREKELKGGITTKDKLVRRSNKRIGSIGEDRNGTVRSSILHEEHPILSSLLLRRSEHLPGQSRRNSNRRGTFERRISYSTHRDTAQSDRSPPRPRLAPLSVVDDFLYPDRAKPEETSEDLSLKPVSSATYYPHRSKSTLSEDSNDDDLVGEKKVSSSTESSVTGDLGGNTDEKHYTDDYICLSSIDQAQNTTSNIHQEPDLNDDASQTNSLILEDRIDEAKELKPGVKLGVTPKSEGVGIWKDKILPDITTKRREMVLPSVDKQDNKNVEITSISNNGESGITPGKYPNQDHTSHESPTTLEGKEEEEEEEGEREYPLAVELKPFTNKVGGHTAIFRFSKRAVCKTLVNRENRWYETMEITNSKLLKFMPKYIGVLNVRQHFRSREDFLNQVPFGDLESSENKKNVPSTISPFDNGSTDRTRQPLKHALSYPDLDTPPLFEVSENAIQDDLAATRFHSGYIYPEVTVDDNKHIMSNALLGRYSLRSLSDDTTREEVLLSPKSRQRSLDSDFDAEDKNDKASCKTKLAIGGGAGSTLLNTKLKDLILEEAFAPICPGKQHSHSSTCVIVPQNRSASSSSAHAAAIRSLLLSNPTDEQDNESIATGRRGLESHQSEVDLKQFHRREVMRVARNQVTGQSDGTLDLVRSPRNSITTTEGETTVQPLRIPESISFEEHTRTIVSKFILLEDLTQHMKKPCALDLKMGTRQYGVDASVTKQRSQRTKCQKTTSMALGVRICGLKTWNKTYYIKRDKYFGRRVKVGWQFARTLARFLYDGMCVRSIVRKIPKLIKQLELLAAEISALKGFRLYGASLLLMYDGEDDPDDKRVTRVKVHLIDFAKCVTRDDLEEGLQANGFKIPPKHPDLEDVGFLRGLKSLKFYLMFIWNYLTVDSPMLASEEELREFLSSRDDIFSKKWDWLDEFDKEDETEFNDPSSPLRKKWRKYELIFDVEPRFNDEDNVSD